MGSILSLLMMSGPVWKWTRRLGGPGLILLGISDNTPFVSAPPGSIDVCLILLAARNPALWAYYALMTTAGEVLGGYLTYRLAEKGGRQTLERKVGQKRAQAVYKEFERFGSMTVLGGALLPPPFPFTTVLMTAGVMQYPRSKFLSALIAGRSARFLIVAWLGRIYSSQLIGFFSRHYHLFLVVLIWLAIAGGAGAAVYFHWYRPRHHSAKTT
jgi:membrane protein YqaA with SNARE-associated domain